MKKVEVTAIILTNNEEANIQRTLKCLDFCQQIIVVDSFSSDKTIDIIYSFPNTSIVQREFDNHTNQWEFARNQVKTEWVLALDADYQISPLQVNEIEEIIKSKTSINGFYSNVEYAIDGKVIKSGIYPPVCILYRRRYGVYKQDGHTQRLKVNGQTLFLKNPLIHDDRKDFKRWLGSQVNYAKLEVKKLTSPHLKLSDKDKLRLRFKITPILVFFYCILVQQGWRDGIEGWKYAFQRLIAEIFLQYYLLDETRD